MSEVEKPVKVRLTMVLVETDSSTNFNATQSVEFEVANRKDIAEVVDKVHGFLLEISSG